jgi:hypothetical protein
MAWRTWTSTEGFSAVTVESGATGNLNVLQLQADPSSSDVMALYSDANSDLFHRKWNGATWSALGPAVETDLSSTGRPEPFMFVWQTNPVTVPVTVTSVSLIDTSITPQLQYAVTVSVSYAAGLADLDELVLKIFHDSDGGTPTDAEAMPQIADTQNCAIITWTQASDTFVLEPSGAGSTWSIGVSSSPPGLPGDFVFVFTPGKVATESAGPALWQLWASATTDGGQTASNYDVSPPTMNWYGEIAVNTPSVDWGTVDPGTGFADNINEMGSISLTYISNGDHDRQVRSDVTWTGATNNATFDSTGATENPQEFSLMAYVDDSFGSAVQVDTTGVSIDPTGTQTGEAGDLVANNTLWLKLASVFGIDTYNGDVTYIIADR